MSEGQPVRRWETARVEAFSDGVFAIAITLLVLDIRIDTAEYEDLWRALADEWPAYLAYVTSFLTVGSVWIAHHSLFSHLRYIDPVLLRLNLLLLMAAAFLPFPTGVLAQAFHASEDAERTAVALYGATALVIELLLQASVRYAASRPELAVGPVPSAPAPRPSRGWRQLLGASLYGLAILVGILLLPKLAAAGYLLVAARGVFVVGSEGRLSIRWLKRA
jgi:TMEM175 potassium channel family protein